MMIRHRIGRIARKSRTSARGSTADPVRETRAKIDPSPIDDRMRMRGPVDIEPLRIGGGASGAGCGSEGSQRPTTVRAWSIFAPVSSR
jgi:hypothetical protein